MSTKVFDTKAGRYIDWIGTQGAVKDYFGEIEAGLRAKGIVQSVKG